MCVIDWGAVAAFCLVGVTVGLVVVTARLVSVTADLARDSSRSGLAALKLQRFEMSAQIGLRLKDQLARDQLATAQAGTCKLKKIAGGSEWANYESIQLPEKYLGFLEEVAGFLNAGLLSRQHCETVVDERPWETWNDFSGRIETYRRESSRPNLWVQLQLAGENASNLWAGEDFSAIAAGLNPK